MVHVYLSGPIIHAELRKEDFYQGVVNHLESRGITVFAPQFLEPAEPAEIYRRDVEQVRKCDVIIAEVSNPSLGVGMEIMLAREIETPILLFRQSNAKPLSKMVEGTDRKALFEYTSVDEVVEILSHLDFEKIHYSDECPRCKCNIAEYQKQKYYRCVQCRTDF
ncbi:MAG: nucleoside 2-deoxyribosyltransferase [Candidatus Thorarchaeota archaeon]